MWVADKVAYRNEDNFVRAYLGNTLIWEKATNVIYYTSTNGQRIFINYGYDYGANVVSNTYSNGVGKIVFDGSPTKIPTYFMNNETTLASIILSDTITEIGSSSFIGCTSLSSVVLSKNLNAIKGYAFEDCSSLTSIILPDSLRDISGGAFEDSGLTSINIPPLARMLWLPQPFKGCDDLVSITVNSNNANYTDYNSNAIYNSSTYTLQSGCRNTVIHPGTIIIGGYAFYGITSLTSITIPDTVENIQSWAFAKTGITYINIPDSVEDLGECAFDGCVNLTSVHIGSGIWFINDAVFNNCTSLLTVIIDALTPPANNNLFRVFDNNAPGRKIYVPAESLTAYQTARGWSDYASDIVAQ